MTVLAAGVMMLGLENPYWAAMTTVVIAQPVRGQVIAKGLYRVLGTLLGAAAGVAMLLALRALPAVPAALVAAHAGAPRADRDRGGAGRQPAILRRRGVTRPASPARRRSRNGGLPPTCRSLYAVTHASRPPPDASRPS